MFKTSSGVEIHYLKLHFKDPNVLISLLNSDHLTLFDFRLTKLKLSNKLKMPFSFVYTTPSLLENRYVQKIGCSNLILFPKILYKTAKLKKKYRYGKQFENKKTLNFFYTLRIWKILSLNKNSSQYNTNFKPLYFKFFFIVAYLT